MDMVDFKKLAEDHYNNATPEERERIDAYRALEKRYDATRRTIEATVTRLGERQVDQGTGRKPKYELYPLKVTTKNIEMRIEDGSSHNGETYETLRFIGAVTGHEIFALRSDFIEGITKPAETTEENIFSICWGSAKYDRCEVSKTIVEEYLREVRPELFTQAPAPAM
jgi:hypothetical protein